MRIFEGNNNSIPNPSSPSSEGSTRDRGTSLAMRQFWAMATGEIPVHKPCNPWRVAMVRVEELYCLGCCGVRWHDVVIGDSRSLSFCRCCGEEVAR